MNLFRAYTNKLTNKLSGVVRLPARGKKKGSILLSYITAPFTQAPWEHLTDPHTNYWECAEIARLLAERGYMVDVIDASNTAFIPKKRYDLIIDTHQNIERLHDILPKECVKVMHITSAFPAFQNAAEESRLADLRARRGITLSPMRAVTPSENAAYADHLEGFTSPIIEKSYARFAKSIYPIPISVSQQFDFPENKDWAIARTHFMWFGGGGAIHKGLDLTLEAFATTPHLHLHIIGPAAWEKDFAQEFARELTLPNIHVYHRPQISSEGIIMVDGIPFKDIADRCAAIIFPSSCESASGSVIQAMHASLAPIVTPEASISPEAGGMVITDPSVAGIKRIVEDFSQRDPESIKTTVAHSWKYVRDHHTRTTFSEAYARFLGTILP